MPDSTSERPTKREWGALTAAEAILRQPVPETNQFLRGQDAVRAAHLGECDRLYRAVCVAIGRWAHLVDSDVIGAPIWPDDWLRFRRAEEELRQRLDFHRPSERTL